MADENELCLYGGLIYHIPRYKIMEVKNSIEFPSKVGKIIKLLEFEKNDKILHAEYIIFGSYNLKIQPYYSDIDVRCKIVFDLPFAKALALTVKLFKNVIKKIEKTKGVFFTDAKAGVYEDKEAVHWTAGEVIKGYRNKKKDFNGHYGTKKLSDAIIDKSDMPVLLKIDMSAPFFGKYIECTMVYDIYYIDNNNNEVPLTQINNNIIETLVKDTNKQIEKNNYFKVIKRIFALTRYYGDYRTAKLVEPLLISNVSKLASINSDLKTLELLVFLDKKINKNLVNIEINLIRDKLANILDIDFDVYKVIETLLKIYKHIKNDEKEESLNHFEKVINYINNIVNDEVEDYLSYNGIKSFMDFGSKYVRNTESNMDKNYENAESNMDENA